MQFHLHHVGSRRSRESAKSIQLLSKSSLADCLSILGKAPIVIEACEADLALPDEPKLAPEEFCTLEEEAAGEQWEENEDALTRTELPAQITLDDIEEEEDLTEEEKEDQLEALSMFNFAFGAHNDSYSTAYSEEAQLEDKEMYNRLFGEDSVDNVQFDEHVIIEAHKKSLAAAAAQHTSAT